MPSLNAVHHQMRMGALHVRRLMQNHQDDVIQKVHQLPLGTMPEKCGAGRARLGTSVPIQRKKHALQIRTMMRQRPKANVQSVQH